MGIVSAMFSIWNMEITVVDLPFDAIQGPGLLIV